MTPIKLTLGTASDFATITLLGSYVASFDPAAGSPGFVLSDDGTASHATLVQYYVTAPADR